MSPRSQDGGSSPPSSRPRSEGGALTKPACRGRERARTAATRADSMALAAEESRETRRDAAAGPRRARSLYKMAVPRSAPLGVGEQNRSFSAPPCGPANGCGASYEVRRLENVPPGRGRGESTETAGGGGLSRCLVIAGVVGDEEGCGSRVEGGRSREEILPLRSALRRQGLKCCARF